jgi:hypothetical protein
MGPDGHDRQDNLEGHRGGDVERALRKSRAEPGPEQTSGDDDESREGAKGQGHEISGDSPGLRGG